MEYICKITSFWDESTEDDYWNAKCEEIVSDEFEDYDKSMAFLKEQSSNQKANYIEVITSHGCSNRHVSFYRQDHPFSMMEYSYADIDNFAETEKEEYAKRMTEPDEFDLEMQFLDLFAVLAPEQILEGVEPDVLLNLIPNGQSQIRDLISWLCTRMFDSRTAQNMLEVFDKGLPLFMDGFKQASINQEYWEKVWASQETDELFEVFTKEYLNKDMTQEQRFFITYNTNIAFLYFYFGVYFVGLRIYVA